MTIGVNSFHSYIVDSSYLEVQILNVNHSDNIYV
jgi:hypothetical protein